MNPAVSCIPTFVQNPALADFAGICKITPLEKMSQIHDTGLAGVRLRCIAGTGLPLPVSSPELRGPACTYGHALDT